jgi:hypothetical protein
VCGNGLDILATKELGLEGITLCCMPSGAEPRDVLTRGAPSLGGGIVAGGCTGDSEETPASAGPAGLPNDTAWSTGLSKL